MSLLVDVIKGVVNLFIGYLLLLLMGIVKAKMSL